MRKKLRQIGVRLPNDTWEAMTAAVVESGSDQSDWLRDAVAMALDRQALLKAMSALLLAHEGRLSDIVRAEVQRAVAELEWIEAPAITPSITRPKR